MRDPGPGEAKTYAKMAEKAWAGYAVLVVSFSVVEVKRMKLVSSHERGYNGSRRQQDALSLLVGTDVGVDLEVDGALRRNVEGTNLLKQGLGRRISDNCIIPTVKLPTCWIVLPA